MVLGSAENEKYLKYVWSDEVCSPTFDYPDVSSARAAFYVMGYVSTCTWVLILDTEGLPIPVFCVGMWHTGDTVGSNAVVVGIWSQPHPL